MNKFLLFVFACSFLLGIHNSTAQLIITEQTNAIALAQKLVGQGVTITNATFTGNSHMGGFFNNISGTNIGIDSGIVLCTGRVKSSPPFKGIDGDGVTTAYWVTPDNVFNLPGDPDLTNATGRPTGDAAILEFDFIPLGDSINIKYVFGSEEYNSGFVCYFVDAFAFFISGPGITGLKNIALVPGTNLPVSNTNINGALNADLTDCRINQIYYIDNTSSTYMNYDGQTVVLTASEKVQPCQTYHLKLVIADLNNNLGADSGVFLEAQSLTSNSTSITNLTPTDPSSGNHYVVEGCVPGSIKVKRQYASPSAQIVNLTYAGTALNTIDVNTLPASVVIPANQTEVTLNIIPVVDNIPEGTELLKIYTQAAACAIGGAYSDSAIIEIRDYDTLTLTPKTANICRNNSIQLTASTGYTVYAWDANPSLNNTGIRNPVATPTANTTTYYCTASIGNCHARDSVFVRWKDIELLSTKNINCKNGTTGQIKIAAGPEWVGPLLISINNNAFQSDSTFNNLPTGSYSIKVKDATGCIDSIAVTLTQAYPDLTASVSPPTPATCSGNTDGQIILNVNGGLTPYQYSIDNGINYQNGNTFNVLQGNYPLIVKDFNGCLYTTSAIVPLNNDLNLSVANATATICESNSTTLQANSNATSYSWTPVTGLATQSAATTQASPVSTTKYYITATKGICTKKDSVLVNVNPAPIANAGTDITICYGGDTMLHGSGGIDYVWTPSTYLSDPNIAQPNVIRPISNTTYSLQVKDGNGCKSLNSATVKVTVTPAIQIFAPRDTLAAIYQPLQLYATDINNSGITSYVWTPSYGLNNSSIPRPVATLDRDMDYIVTGKTSAGCEGTATVSVKVFEGPEIYVPTAFTPNDDTNNDFLRAKPIGIRTFSFFIVYNRWGQLMFKTTDFLKGWDGTINGQQQSTGTYVWIAEGIDFKGRVITRKGSTLLIR